MQAVILAAGLNTRFSEVYNKPFIKQSLLINDIPILIHSLNSLERIGCSEVILISGENKESLERLVENYFDGDLSISFIENLQPERGNGYSLGTSQKRIRDYFYLLMSDHMYDDNFFELVKNSPFSPTPSLFVDYKINSIYDLDDATKVLEKEGIIVDIGKDIESYNCIDTGFFYLHDHIFETFNELERAKSSISLSEIILNYATANDFRATDIGNAMWQDVDTMEMYNHACKVFRKE